MEISYPLGGVREKREILQNNWLPEGYEFVRFGLKSRKSMLLSSVSYTTIEEFRQDDNIEEREYLVKKLKTSMIEFLKEKSSYTSEQISEKLISLVKSRLEKEKPGIIDEEKIDIILPEDKNILNSVFSLRGEKKGYPFFSRSLIEKVIPFPPFDEKTFSSKGGNYRLLVINKFKFISEYMYARIIYRIGKNDLQKLSLELEDEKIKCEYAINMTEEFKIWKKYLENIEPATVFDLIKTDDNYRYNDDEMNIFCSILELNICLLRAWSDNVSVERYYNYNENYPTICIFVVKEGYYGPTGDYSDTKYYPGGIVENNKVRYYLDPDKDEMIIYQFLRYTVTDNSNIMQVNYNIYLENIKKGTFEHTTTELETISVPEYGKLDHILKERGDVDEIGKIIRNLDLV